MHTLPVVTLLALLTLFTPSPAAEGQTRQPMAKAMPASQGTEAARRVVNLMENRVQATEIVPGEVVVKLKPDAPDITALIGPTAEGSQIRTTSGGELIVTLPPPPIDPADTRSSEERLKQRMQETVALVEQLAGRQDVVEYAQPNFLLQIAREPTDPRYPEQWHYFTTADAAGGIGLPEVWETTTGSDQVLVAVIDTGLVASHPDLDGSNVIAGADLISDPARANDGDGRDTDASDPGDAVVRGECGVDLLGQPVPSRDLPASWHGSHVAGTIGAGITNNGEGIAGINWRVKVLPVRVLGKCGGSIVDINDGIRWAAGLEIPDLPTNPNPADVINLSLGGLARCSDSPSTQRAIDDAVAAGVTVVAAAGNEAQNAANFLPASCDNVITVAASDFNGKLVRRYSNFGDAVDILAPGGDVLSDENHDGMPDGVLSFVQGGYDFYNGTSMAAPHVAGVAALLEVQQPDLTPAAVEALLKQKALPRSSAQCPVPCGAGLLDATFLTGDREPPDEEGGERKEKPKVPDLSLVWFLIAAGGLGLWALARRRRAA